MTPGQGPLGPQLPCNQIELLGVSPETAPETQKIQDFLFFARLRPRKAPKRLNVFSVQAPYRGHQDPGTKKLLWV